MDKRKIHIWRSIKFGFLQTARNVKTILIVAWIPFLLMLFLGYVLNGWVIDYLEGYYASFSVAYFIFDLRTYVLLLLDCVIFAPFLVALYRFYILEETPYSMKDIRYGITRPRTLFRLRWSFPICTRNTLGFMALSLIMALIVQVGEHLIIWFSVSDKESFGEIDPQEMSAIMIGYGVLEHAFYALLILLYPAVAIAPKLSQIKLFTHIRPMLFAFPFIMILSYMLYAPLSLLDTFAEPFLTQIEMEEGFPLSYDSAYEIYNTLRIVLIMLILSIEAAILSAIYKNLKKAPLA